MKNLRIALLVIFFAFSLSFCSKRIVSTSYELDYPGYEDVGTNNALGIVWEELPGNPVLELPKCPEWNCLGATDPWIAKGPEEQLFAWFSTGGSLGGPVIGRAVIDNNLDFKISPQNQPVLKLQDGEWNKHRETVSVWWSAPSQEWFMWYLGYRESFFEDPGIGQMRSNDPEGIEWPRSSEPIYRPDPDGWDQSFISGPTFIETKNGEWRLYYTGAGTTVGVGVLISDDQGETWRPHPENPVFERDLENWDQGILEQSILYVNGRYMMWYSGYEEPLNLEETPIYIGLVTSEDGISWQRSPYNPVLGPANTGSWNDLRIVAPHIILMDDGSLLMAAHGQNIEESGRILGRIGLWQSRER
mgnify:CR=1 FL=1